MKKLSALMCIAMLFLPTVLKAAQEHDWLDLANGAVILAKTGEYSDKWSALLIRWNSSHRLEQSRGKALPLHVSH